MKTLKRKLKRLRYRWQHTSDDDKDFYFGIALLCAMPFVFLLEIYYQEEIINFCRQFDN